MNKSDRERRIRTIVFRMRVVSLALPVALFVITTINLSYGIPPAPLWFYLVIIGMAAMFWLLTVAVLLIVELSK